MLLIMTYLLSMLEFSFPDDTIKYDTIPKGKKIRIIGRAIIVKNYAAVRTDDSLVYYLDRIPRWDEKYEGKRIKVTGKLIIVKYEKPKITDTVVTALPQVRLGTWKIIKKPKWSLVGE